MVSILTIFSEGSSWLVLWVTVCFAFVFACLRSCTHTSRVKSLQCTHLDFVYVIWNDYCPHSTRTRTWKVLQKARKLVLRSTSTLRRSFKLPLLGLVGYVTTASLCSHCTQFDFSESTESASLRLRAYALGMCFVTEGLSNSWMYMPSCSRSSVFICVRTTDMEETISFSIHGGAVTKVKMAYMCQYLNPNCLHVFVPPTHSRQKG